jgi:tRNA U34 5-methylaminomethyl-2-thiouridine-forming methyltransferase MnmC
MTPANRLVITSDGSHTIFVPELNEHYHSVYGAVQEAEHIFIKNGLEMCERNPVYIFEVGFGTGLNALITAARCEKTDREVVYTTIEKYPIEEELVLSLNHHTYAGNNGDKLSLRLHQAKPGVMTRICRNFSIRKIIGDIITDNIEGFYDLIYFDAFGPDKQPEMWTSKIFEKISAVTNPGGLFLTYSAKGEVKRNLMATGFKPTLLPGPPGKREILRAIKK